MLMNSLRERDGDLINHWYVIALSRELPDNKPIHRQLYGQHYVLFRDENKKIGVLQDRCIHRGAQLSKGRCEKGQIQCPYHGWTFNREGILTEVPSEGPESCHAIQTKNWKVPSLPVKEQDGCIWVWPGDLSKMTAEPSWRFPNYGNNEWAQYFMITDFDDEVTRLVQNFMDVPHTVFVHSKWFRNRRLLKVPIEIQNSQGRVKVTYHQPNDSIGFMERILNPNREPMLHTDEFIFPNITRVDYQFGKYGFIINSQCTPVSEFKTRVYTWITYNVGVLTKPLKPFMQFYTRRVIEQDVEIMKNLGDNFQRFGEMTYKSTSADELHLAIDRLRLQGRENRSLVSETNYKKEREFWI